MGFTVDFKPGNEANDVGIIMLATAIGRRLILATVRRKVAMKRRVVLTSLAMLRLQV